MKRSEAEDQVLFPIFLLLGETQKLRHLRPRRTQLDCFEWGLMEPACRGEDACIKLAGPSICRQLQGMDGAYIAHGGAQKVIC